MLNSILMILFLSIAALAQGSSAAENPCEQEKVKKSAACLQICNACVSSGFRVGQSKSGNGFWIDCAKPILAGMPIPTDSAKTGHILPAAPPSGWTPIASLCKTQFPEWGASLGSITPARH